MSEILTDFSSRAIITAIQANAYAFFIRREKILGKTIREESGITWIEAPTVAPVAWLHGLISADESPGRTAQTARSFTSQGLNEVYLVAFETGQCCHAWNAAGACLIESEHAMAISLAGMSQVRTANRSLSIEYVSSDAVLQECTSVISAGRDQWTAGFFQLTNPSLAAGQESMRYYLARIEGRAVATAVQFFWAGLAGIWWVTTTPELRRRGVATAITREALADATRLGYRVAMLECLPDAVPMYRRLGFREYCRINVYRWKSPP